MKEKKDRDVVETTPPSDNSILQKVVDANILENQSEIKAKEILTPFIYEGVNLIVGEPRTGKTWLMLQLCKEMNGKIFYYSEDSRSLIQHRLKQLHIPSGKIQILFNTELEKDPNIEEIFSTAHQLGCNIIIIDTMMLIMNGGKDPDFTQISYTIRHIKKLQKQYGIDAVVITHHTRKKQQAEGKSNKELDFSDIYGSQGLRAAADSVTMIQALSTAGNTHQSLLTTETKIIDAGVTKYVVETENYKITKIQDAKAVIEQNTENIVLHYITRMHETGESTTPKNVIQAIRTDHPEISENAIRIALSRLKGTGKIEKKGTQYIPAPTEEIEDDEI